MHMRAKELELKLELPPASLPAIKKLPLLRGLKVSAQRTSETSIYFDTDGHKLRKKGLMPRVRRVGQHYLQTIKASENSGAFERDEWEAEISGTEPDLRLARGTALDQLAKKKKLSWQLKPLFETTVRRTLYTVSHDGHEIALTIDWARSTAVIIRFRCARSNSSFSAGMWPICSTLRASSQTQSTPAWPSRASRNAATSFSMTDTRRRPRPARLTFGPTSARGTHSG